MLRILMVAAAIASLPAQGASNGEVYRLTGVDGLRIGSAGEVPKLSYNACEQLHISRTAGNGGSYKVFTVGTVSTARSSQPISLSTSVVLLPDGERRDARGDDPQYVSILSAPFPIVLDAATRRELIALKGVKPFAFASAMTGSALHGELRRFPTDAPNRLGIRFDARGPVVGSLPGGPDLPLHGAITLEGRAVYSDADALLESLETTLVVDGSVGEGARAEPVRLVQTRRFARTGQPCRVEPQRRAPDRSVKPPGP